MVVNDTNVKSKLGSVKKHIIEHRSKYIAGGTLLLGFGLGLYLSNKKYGRNEGPTTHRIESLYRKNDNAKIIGTFTEINGEEYDVFDDLKKAKKLIGSTSADVGDVELYYDINGTTYVVAHNFESYYGKKS